MMFRGVEFGYGTVQTCFQGVCMGVDIGTYLSRIGSSVANYKRKNTMGGWKVEADDWQTWFWDFVLIVVLVIGGAEVNLVSLVEQEKIKF